VVAGKAVPLVGRSSELEQLHALLADVSRGVGRVAIVEGEAGIGKSRLLRSAMETATTLGFHVASGAAQELERDRAFGLIADAFGLHKGAHDALRREIVALIESEAGASDVRFRIIERVIELAEATAIDQPLLVALEDLHWADASTVLTLSRLVTSIEHIAVALVCSMRPTPRSTELATFLDGLDAFGVRLSLCPLDEPTVGELVTATLGASPGPRLLAKLGGAAGNPLFISELLSALAQEGLIDTHGGTAEVGDVSTPPSLALTILRRLAFLSDESLDTLRIASVLGATFTMKDLSVVMGKSAIELLPAIEEAAAAALIVESGDQLMFRHELVRDAIYGDMLQPVRKALHAQAARTLAGAGAPAAQVATHAAIGADVGDIEAVDALRRAAKDALAQAPATALSFLERASELACGDPQRCDEIDLYRVNALLLVGRSRDAARTARELLAHPIAREIRFEAQRMLIFALTTLNLTDEALAEVETAAAGSLSPTEEALLAAAKAHALHVCGTDLARPAAERAIELGELAGDALSVFVGTQALSFCNGFDGYLDDAIRMVDRAKEVAAAAFAKDRYANERVNRRLYLIWADRFDEAGRELDATLSEAESFGALAASTYHYTKAHLELWSGHWDEAAAVAEAGLMLGEQEGIAIDHPHLVQLLCFIALNRDELAEAESRARDLVGAAWIPALLAEAKGDGTALNDILQSYRASSVESPRPWNMAQAIWWAPDWVRLYVEAGDRRSALVMTEMLEDAARRAKTPTAMGAALRSRGLYEDSADLLLQAVDMHRRGPRVFDRAQACEWAAVGLRGEPGSPEQAVALLDEALDIYESVGARRAAGRAEAHLRALGVRRGRRGPRQRPKTGWESLTETERRVTGLVAEGLPYRQIGDRLFISRRTVETHVAHVFLKLGMASRRELAEAARARV
jgi:DNA-binding CsgD family transcriptional regulator